MNVVYQIKSVDLLAYTTNIADCDDLCVTIINNGYPPPFVRRMKRTDVPLSDLELINEL